MKRNIYILILNFFTAAVVISTLASCKTPSDEFDFVIANGTIVDGSGGPRFQADIGIKDGIIVAMGDLGKVEGLELIDAKGKIVSPGFIDIHSHADDSEDGRVTGLRSSDTRRREASNLNSQGITTVVVNSDGDSPPDLSIAEQRAELESDDIGLNVALMVGHLGVRAHVMGQDYRRAATPEEIVAMRTLVREGMEQGAFGFTSGLEYNPGRWGDTDELVALMEEIAPYNGAHISHMRSETSAPMWWVPSQHDTDPPQLLDAISEIIEIAERTGTVGVCSHIKVRGTTHWGQSLEVIKLINDARARGVRIYGDQYPYSTSGSDGKIVFIPEWAVASAKGNVAGKEADYTAALLNLLESEEQRALLYADIRHSIAFRGGAESILVFDHPNKNLIGRSLNELANERKIEPVDMVIKLQIEGYSNKRGGARLRSFSLQEKDMENLMTQPWVATVSDTGIYLLEDGPAIHARSYGAFPRKISRYVRERNTVSLEHAVRSATSLPAEIMGLTHRGEIKVGYVADIVIFDYEEITDKANFTQPHQKPRGIDYVWINGQAVVFEGQPTHARPGKVLRKTP